MAIMSMLASQFLLVALMVVRCDATCHTSSDDCTVKFGPWSDCDPCSKQQSRHAKVVTTPQFDGMPCPENFVEHKPCAPTTICPADLQCPGQFDCEFAGRCVNDSLVCNGDDDCGNNADERNCTETPLQMRSIAECLNLDPVPYLDQIGSGVHLVSGKLAGRVVDNQRYQGVCRKAFDGDHKKIYRLPYNVDNFHFHVKTADDLQVKSYSSLSQYTKALDEEKQTSWSASANVHGGLWGWHASISGSVSYSHSSTFHSVFNSMKDEQSTMFHVSSEIQTAEFVLKEDSLLLDGFLEQRINKLPTTLNTKSYFDFFTQYGVSYLHSGVLGGRYEHFYIFSNDAMRQSDQTTKTLSKCVKSSMSASLGFGSLYGASGSYKSSKCSSNSGTEKDSSEVSQSASHTVVNIDGGTSEMAGKLAGAAVLGKDNLQVTKFENWVAGVQQNPVLLYKTVRPVCDLILSSKDTRKKLKHEICMNATVAYLQPYSLSGCKSCNNGRPINMNGKCHCACDGNYTGQTCATKFVSTPPPHYAGSTEGNNGTNPTDSSHDIKFVLTDLVASNPPYMQWRNVGPFDTILKMKDNHVFLLSSTRGSYVFNGTRGTGEYWIQEYDEFLQPLQSTKIDFTTIDHCNKGSGFCFIRDFDVDVHGNFIIAVKIDGDISSSVCKLDKDGIAVMQITHPCAMDDSSDPKTIYVTTTCLDQIVVNCPSLTPATVKVFNTEGHPQYLTQFPGYNAVVTGIQHFQGSVWIHTLDNQVVAYNILSWDKTFTFAGLSGSGVNLGAPLNYCQLSVDFLGNLIIGQAQNHEDGKLNYKITIVEGESKSVLAYVKLDHWNNCLNVATYRGKLYTLCERLDDASKKSILIFDYLK